MKPTDNEKINAVLNELGISAFQLTKELNLSASTIYHVLNGQNRLTIKIINLIVSKYPKINKEYLLKGVGNVCVEEKAIQENDFIVIKKQEFEQIKQDIAKIYEILKKSKLFL